MAVRLAVRAAVEPFFTVVGAVVKEELVRGVLGRGMERAATPAIRDCLLS